MWWWISERGLLALTTVVVLFPLFLVSVVSPDVGLVSEGRDPPRARGMLYTRYRYPSLL